MGNANLKLSEDKTLKNTMNNTFLAASLFSESDLNKEFKYPAGLCLYLGQVISKNIMK